MLKIVWAILAGFLIYTVLTVPQTVIAAVPVIKRIQTTVPAALVDAGEAAEGLYDSAKAKNWKRVKDHQVELEKAVVQLKSLNIDTSQLDPLLGTIKISVATENRDDLMLTANKATLVAAEMTEKYHPKIPVDVTKLDYLGREIEIWAAKNDKEKLVFTAKAIRRTWNAVKPQVEANKGTKESATFESLVAGLDKAQTVADYLKLAKPILDEVDHLEAVFEKH